MSEKRDTEELEFSSPNFNPSKALRYPDKIKLPCPSAPTLDNISCFIETPDGIFPKPRKERKEKEPKELLPKAGTSKDEPTNKEKFKRGMKNVKNVLTRMEEPIKGPLSFIKNCMDEKLRVKVYTRGAVQVRGFCVGFVIAFDKHLNLVLKDVFETWTRRRKRKTPFLGPVQTPEEAEDSKSNVLSRIREQEEIYNQRRASIDMKPRIIIRQRLKRKEICERHIDQMLIRGEQIVIVTLETNTDYQIFKTESRS